MTVPPRPNGSPIASTQSPTRALFESPQPMTGSGCLAFTLSSAKSVTASRPTTSAGRLVSSGSVTVMLSASAMTWLLVTTSPVGSMMKPEPSDGERGDGKAGAPLPPPSPQLPSRSPKKSWKNSSKGVPRPASALGPCGAALCDVAMLTTAGVSFSASSEKPSGPRAAAGALHNASASAAAIRTGRWAGCIDPLGMSISPSPAAARCPRTNSRRQHTSPWERSPRSQVPPRATARGRAHAGSRGDGSRGR